MNASLPRGVASALLLALAFAPGAIAQNTHYVRVGAAGANSFEPAELVLAVGDTVEWVWESGVHNVSASSGAFSSGAPVGAPMSYSVTFDGAFLSANPVPGGVYAYQCDPHAAAGMVGSVKVLPARDFQATFWSPGALYLKIAGGGVGNMVHLGYSLAGNGPTPTPYGTLALTPPFAVAGSWPFVLYPMGQGVFVIQLLTYPASASGRTVHLHALEMLGGGRALFLEPKTLVLL